ncbi:MAG: nucleotide pyrophosphohydrolase [Chloroflexi bacterium]|nr:nucleotide pyrophosphohydrolase [Chloroflexota bacterium]
MDLDTLTRAMYDFVESNGWLAEDSPKKQTRRNLAISLVLEASEVLEHFQWRDETDRPDELAEELADVMLYLLQLASFSGIDLGQAVMAKLDKNYARDWHEHSQRSTRSTQ